MDNNIITIQDLLLWGNKNADFEKEATGKQRIKFIKHQGQNPLNWTSYIDGKVYQEKTISAFYRKHKEAFWDFQNEQKLSNFKNVEYVISLMGEENGSARFIGVFKNCKKESNNRGIFDFKKVDGFEELEEKVIINFGTSRQCYQFWDNNKYVIRIDCGFEENIPAFISYADVILDYYQLKTIFDKNSEEWRTKLEACNCVYLILDKFTGQQYVGVTYRDHNSALNGIWGRWQKYVETGGHGDNKKLEELWRKDNDYPKNNFQWSILETLPLNVTAEYAIGRESLYKEKFGTREHGYNNN